MKGIKGYEGESSGHPTRFLMKQIEAWVQLVPEEWKPNPNVEEANHIYSEVEHP